MFIKNIMQLLSGEFPAERKESLAIQRSQL